MANMDSTGRMIQSRAEDSGGRKYFTAYGMHIRVSMSSGMLAYHLAQSC